MEIMDLEEKDIAKLQTNVMLSNISGSIFEIITGVFMVFLGASIYMFEIRLVI